MREPGLSDQSVRHTVALYAAVAAGSALGSAARWLVSLVLQSHGAALPWATLFANATGSFAIGWYAAGLALRDPTQVDAVRRAFAMVGLCGGYTTFSIFSLETLMLLQHGRSAAAGANVAISVTAWLVAVWGGYALRDRWQRRALQRAP
jgi:fluoride exporter